MKVLVLTGYPLDRVPGQRFRFEQHLSSLARAGIQLEVSSYLTEHAYAHIYGRGTSIAKVWGVAAGIGQRIRDLLVAREYSAVLVFREATPLGYPFVEAALAAQSIPYAYDFDDAIFLPNASDANRWLTPLKYSGKVSEIARKASVVVTGNEYLADWARGHNSNVRVIPTTIDTALYRPRGKRRSGELCIGWSGSLTTVRYLRPIAPVLRQLQQTHGVRLRVIGDASFAIPDAQVEALPWRAETEVSDLQEIDIGLMPLPDDDWARGKCGLKALQYMALGIPTVMSPVGVNKSIAAGDAALLAQALDEWYAALDQLITDPHLRKAIGSRGRERVERSYSASVAGPQWADVFRSIARRGVARNGG